MEQTMSAFVPDVVATQVMKDLNLPQGKRTADLPRMVEKGLQKIYRAQNEDGGWGWSEGDETTAYMTAWAIDGLLQARKADYPVDETRIRRGVQALKRMLQQAYQAKPSGPEDAGYLDRYGPDTRAYMVYALSEAGAATGRQLEQTFRERSRMNVYTRALLALSYHEAGNMARARQVLEELKRKAIVSKSECHWESKAWHYSWTDDDLEGTAFVLKALARVMPDDPLIPKIIQWILSQRTGDHWVSTKQSAAVVYALAEVLGQTVLRSPPRYTARLAINGRDIGAMEVTPENALTQEQVFQVERNLLQEGSNRIHILKEGKGTLMYSAELRYVARADDIQPSGDRFVITRSYFRLVPRVDAKNKVTYVPEPMKGEARSGELLQVEMAINAKEPLRYMIIEDYLPSGCEPMAQTEFEEAKEGQTQTLQRTPRLWGRRETRDERISFLCESVPKGKSTITYRLRAVLPGQFAILPAQGYGMYRPEVRANSAEDGLRIR